MHRIVWRSGNQVGKRQGATRDRLWNQIGTHDGTTEDRRWSARHCRGRCVSQASAVEGATHPFQYALSTRAGTECVAHMVQALTSMDDRATNLSVDGVGGYDSISRNAMFQGVADMVDGEKIIPFVRQFYDSPSQFLWQDDMGEVHKVIQGEGGEQGDRAHPRGLVRCIWCWSSNCGRSQASTSTTARQNCGTKRESSRR